jgi:uncharacterized short protein YbdD (DUF466 family)
VIKRFFSPRVLAENLLKVWHRLNGDTAYQTYLKHWQIYHADKEASPMTRKAYFSAETKRKWNGIKRCC